ncbi:hypothetical protein Misp01_59650 [Microtetraspora sp. NBRC 13810]|uniref:serine/threonine-protein kinase n=1 Tax=Microtetraspora sp. NBRC 13810 TaxID=3030990 RepID=UPI0024A145AF|nr:serine/threonine-protein kinase [Microtetraspora sp. NBRC 13810]GLW10837.1 hypothetical protein Misp01_59650 [Microtetraspora sp. NBRC 13810]
MLGPGTLLAGRYRLHHRLGGGGMGEVWRGDDDVLGRMVAVKVLLPALMDDPGFIVRFRGEARAMASLRHPHVVDVYDHGACELDDGSQVSYLVMEYVEGESLDRALRRGPLPAAEVMRLVVQVGEALAAAHEQGIVHRDVKPANLMVRAGGGIVLTDFGIARSAAGDQLTTRGMVLGSVGYCAPEQASAGEITPAVDIYSLGVVAYQCLAGRAPFEGETPVQIIFKHLKAEADPLPAHVTPAQRQVVERAMAKDPAGRWSSAAEMAQAARRAAEDPGARPLAGPAAPRSRRRRALTILATAAAALLATAVLGAAVWLRQPDARTLAPSDADLRQPTPTAAQLTPSAEPPTVVPQESEHRPRRTPGRRVTERPAPSPSLTPTVTPTREPTTKPSEPPTTTPTEPTADPDPDPDPDPTGPTAEPSEIPPAERQIGPGGGCTTEPCP